MEVQTQEFGTLQVDEQEILTFPVGLYGLEEYRNYVLIRPDQSLPFAYLQAVEESQISLLVADPFAFEPTYEFELPSHELEVLGEPDLKNLSVWVTVSMNQTLKEATMNLLAPLVLNLKQKIGKQVVLNESGYATRVPLFPQPKEGA